MNRGKKNTVQGAKMKAKWIQRNHELKKTYRRW